MKFINLLLFLLVSTAFPAVGAVPPEVPASRTSQIFSPFYFGFGDDGEGILTSGGPKQLSYQIVNNFQQGDEPVHGIAAVAGLPQFIGELQSTAGLQFISSHGEIDLLLVETFTTGLQGFDDATRHNNGYIAAGTVLRGETVVQDTNGNNTGYYGIYITGAGISRLLNATSAVHPIVFNSSCRSSSLAPYFAGAGIRGYLGYSTQALCPTGTGDAGTVFNTMSGIQAINGVFRNYSLGTGYLVAHDNSSLLEFDPKNASANSIRLYNAPRLILGEVGKTRPA